MFDGEPEDGIVLGGPGGDGVVARGDPEDGIVLGGPGENGKENRKDEEDEVGCFDWKTRSLVAKGKNGVEKREMEKKDYVDVEEWV